MKFQGIPLKNSSGDGGPWSTPTALSRSRASIDHGNFPWEFPMSSLIPLMINLFLGVLSMIYDQLINFSWYFKCCVIYDHQLLLDY